MMQRAEDMAEMIHFERPVIDQRKTPEQNLAVLDRWAAELVNNLNLILARINRERTNGNNNENERG